jgi:5'(3')-deoxyribonucleotidase
VQGDVLIDDHDFNLSAFPGRAIVFSSPHNMLLTAYERMNGWKDAKLFFEGLE